MTNEGQPAPALDLPADNGGRVSLAALRGNHLRQLSQPRAG